MAKSRFVDERSITVRPGAPSVIDVGEFSLLDGEDTIWVHVTSESDGECPWPWSYGLFTWISDNGRELGTVKVNGVCEGEIFRLGVGLAPEFRTGRLAFTPRNYNLKWIELDHPWRLSFRVASGMGSPPAQEPENTNTLIAPFVPEVPLGNALPTFEVLDGLAYLFFNLFTK
jgi:hypothetical protein